LGVEGSTLEGERVGGERALRFILEGLEGAGWSPGFGLKRKPIFGGRFKRGKFWAPKPKTRSKSHFKPKSNSGLDLEGKARGPCLSGWALL
jgi:hypothetical protein